MQVCLNDGSVQTVLRAVTLRQTLHIKLAISSSYSILTPGQPVLVLTSTWRGCRWTKKYFKSLVWLDQKKVGSFFFFFLVSSYISDSKKFIITANEEVVVKNSNSNNNKNNNDNNIKPSCKSKAHAFLSMFLNLLLLICQMECS